MSSDICNGVQFRAVLRFDTPLAVLERHEWRHYDLNVCPPQYVDDPDHGYWAPKLKTMREIGVDMDESHGDWMASHVGPIPLDGGDYIRFLIAIRNIVERCDPAQDRKRLLSIEVMRPEWGKFNCFAGHHVSEICDYFFPTFLATVPSLPYYAAEAMWDVALDTPQRIDGASDAQLLAFKGIGPAVLRKLRARCAEVTQHRDDSILDLVK